MCEVSMMARATIFFFRKANANVRFSQIGKTFSSGLKFIKKIKKCVQVDFGVANYESVTRFS